MQYLLAFSHLMHLSIFRSLHGQSTWRLKKSRRSQTLLFWDVYNSSLYSKTGEYQAEKFPQALKINYLRDIDAEDLIERTQDEWEKLGIKQVTFSQWIPLLTNIFPDIKKGDTLLLSVSENQQSEFFFNGKTIGKITDQTFGKSFLRIWLDENCSYPKVRNKLIGSNKWPHSNTTS